MSFDTRLSNKPALTYFRPQGLSSAPKSSLLSSEWVQVFPIGYMHRQGLARRLRRAGLNTRNKVGAKRIISAREQSELLPNVMVILMRLPANFLSCTVNWQSIHQYGQAIDR